MLEKKDMSCCVSNLLQSSSNKLFSILQYSDISALFSINTLRETDGCKSSILRVFSDIYGVYIWREIASVVQFCQRSNKNTLCLIQQSR